MDFRYFSKKSQNRFLKRICSLAQNIPLFLPRSSHMVKPLLGMCRVDPGDVFTYLSWSHIMSRSNFRIRENFFSNFTFYAYFIKGNFKALPEKLFSAGLTKFFRRILKPFLISKNNIDLKSGDVLTSPWVGFHYGLWSFEWYFTKLPKNIRP